MSRIHLTPIEAAAPAPPQVCLIRVPLSGENDAFPNQRARRIPYSFDPRFGRGLAEDIQTMLEPNMVVSMEPMIMNPEGRPGAGGHRKHDSLVVTEDGAEGITKFSYGPEHHIVKP